MRRRLLLYSLNFAPEEIGIGKYTGEMVSQWLESGYDVVVVTAPPYYPEWEVKAAYRSWWYETDSATSLPSNSTKHVPEAGNLRVVRCPLWVPKRVNGFRRIVHLSSFALSSLPVVLWQAFRFRPQLIMTVEPAAFCMPATWVASKLVRAKSWLHVQDFEVDAAYELGILRQPLLRRIVSSLERFWMRRFDRVSSISGRMVAKLRNKGVAASKTRLVPNWVDCDKIFPIEHEDSIETASRRAELRRGFGIPEKGCVLMYSGNLGAKQGIEVIIEAARRAAERDREDDPVEQEALHFVICGQGAAHDYLRGLAKGLENIHWLPLQPLERFNDLLNAADIHLLPQKARAADLVMPSKLTGMLAVGRPIVACAEHGTELADVVEHVGYVAKPGDADSFCRGIELLANDRGLREKLGREARSVALGTLSRTKLLNDLAFEIEALIPVPNARPDAEASLSDQEELDAAVETSDANANADTPMESLVRT
ncbi:MAG: WcaI family glycosyltransferase [Planctomycetota bacterium]